MSNSFFEEKSFCKRLQYSKKTTATSSLNLSSSATATAAATTALGEAAATKTATFRVNTFGKGKIPLQDPLVISVLWLSTHGIVSAVCTTAGVI